MSESMTRPNPDDLVTTVEKPASFEYNPDAAGSKTGNEGNAKKKRGGKKRKRPYIPILIALLVLAVVVWQVSARFLTKPVETVQTQRLSEVIRGNLTVAVTGSGPLQPINKRTVSSEVDSTILEILHINGDKVKVGDILVTLDNTNTKSALKNAESNLQDAMVTADTTTSDLASLMVRAPFDGIVSEIAVLPDDTVPKNGPLLTLTDTKHLKLTVPFGISDLSALKVGQVATLTLSSISGTVSGTVAVVGQNGYTSSDGGVAVDVEISILNPGALAAGMSATVELQTTSGPLTALAEGALEYANVKVLRSEAGGDVLSVAARKNQAVKRNKLLVVMKNTSLTTTAQSDKTKIDNLTTSVEDAQANLESCTVRATMDGIVTGLDGTVGDSVKAGAALCSILDTTAMTLKISIDELDIATIEPGQSVTATADAVAATTTKALIGTVTSIAVEGTSSNGVTTYPVTLTLDPDARLKSGMNADASILVTNRENVLMVPIEAVTTINGRSFVYVSGTPSVTPATSMGAFGMPGGRTGRANGTANVSGSAGASASAGTAGNVGGAAGSGTNRQRNRGTGNGATGAAATPGASGSTNASGGFTLGSNAAGSTSGQASGGFARPGSEAATGYYAGATLVMVEVGKHNETYMEIISGLSESDQVVLPALTTTTGTKTTAQQSGFSIPGMGGGGGGVPGGNFRGQQD